MNFFKNLKWVEIRRHTNSDLNSEEACASAIRLYRDSPEGAILQVRGPQSLTKGRSITHTVIGSAHLKIADVIELRTAIDELLADFPDYAYKNAGIKREGKS